MSDKPVSTLDGRKDRRGLLALIGAGGAAAVAALLGRSNGAHAADGDNVKVGQSNSGTSVTTITMSGSSTDATFYAANAAAAGPALQGLSVAGDGVQGLSGFMGTSIGRGVYGYGHWGVVGEGLSEGSIGVLAKNDPGRRGLRTRGQVQMDCVRQVTLTAKSTKVTLPSGTKAGTNAVVLATVQGNPGNDAVIWRAYRVDSTHIRIVFTRTPANPTVVAYWVVRPG